MSERLEQPMHPSHKFMLDNIDFPDFYLERLEWVFEGGVPAWERFNVQRVVSMAACIVNKKLFVGNRHFCRVMLLQMEYAGHLHGSGSKREHNINKDQGFIDQYGVWMSRQEAYQVAKAAGQLKFHKEYYGETLYSESYL